MFRGSSGKPFGTQMTRRNFVKSALVATSGLVSLVILGRPSRAGSVSASSGVALDPETASLIRGTLLEHMVLQPAPSELTATIKNVLDGARLEASGDLSQAEAAMRLAVESNPASRMAHAGLGTTLLNRYALSGEQPAVDEAVAELTQADMIGVDSEQVFFQYAIGRSAPYLSSRSSFDGYFAEVGPRVPSYNTLLGRGVGLRLLGDAEAEPVLLKAHAVHPRGLTDAAVELGMYYVAGGRYQDAIDLLSPPSLSSDELTPLVHLVRGVANERLGNLDEASADYAAYVPLVQVFPVPEELRINGSDLQRPLYPLAGASGVTGSDVVILLAKIVQGEAGGESNIGAKRAVAWTVRTRVFKGAVACCITPIDNSGSTREDKYWNVMNQTDGNGNPQFHIATYYNGSSGQTAYAVYGGAVPDPVNGGCVQGTRSGDACTGTCSSSTLDGAFVAGPRVFFSTTGSCGSQFSCVTQGGKTCGDGGYDNCFSYSNCQDCCSGGCPC